MKNDITLDQLQKAHIQAAKVVSIYGEKYLPIFERIEKECIKRQRKIALLTKAQSIFNSNNTE